MSVRRVRVGSAGVPKGTPPMPAPIRQFSRHAFAFGIAIVAVGTLFGAAATAEPAVTPPPLSAASESPEQGEYSGPASFYQPLVSLFDNEDGDVAGEAQPASPDFPMTLRYKIILADKNGDVREVTDKHRFRSGDRIRLVFEANAQGHLYIFQRGSSGRGQLLFPDRRINEGRNTIEPYRRVSLPPPTGPSQGWWEFDANKGEEQIYLFFSPKPIDDLQALIPNDGGYVDDAGWQVVSERRTDAESADPSRVYYEPAGAEGWDYPDEPPSAYVVSRQPVLFYALTLRHSR